MGDPAGAPAYAWYDFGEAVAASAFRLVVANYQLGKSNRFLPKA